MSAKNKVKKIQTRSLIKTRDFDVEEIYNNYEQSKLCLLISHKQILHQKYTSQSVKLSRMIHSLSMNLNFFIKMKKILNRNS